MCDSRAVHAEVKGIWTEGFEPLSTVRPETEDFAVPIRFDVGVAGTEGGDNFSLLVCSPAWLANQDLPRLGSGLLIVDGFNPSAIEKHLKKVLGNVSGETPRQVMRKVARLADWEFDYLDDRRTD